MRASRTIVIVVVACLLVASCGGHHGNGPVRSAEDQSEFDFVACVRHHGVTIRDPFHRPGHVGLSLETPGSPAGRRATDACRHLLKGNIGAKANFAASPEFLEFNLELAQCLRQHGQDVPDPTPQNPDAEGIGADKRNTPQFQAADVACRAAVPMPTIPGIK